MVTAKVVRLTWTAEKQNDAMDIRRSTGCLQTSLKSPMGSRSKDTEGSRSSSQARRRGWIMARKASVAAPPASSAHCQPNANANGAAARPAAIPPSGTPVCLTEKIRLRFSGFDIRISRCAPAGLVSP